MPDPIIVPRSHHGISRSDISREALKVLYRLHRLGYRAYLVGGGVRDLLIGKKPKDFDVGTDARPNRLKKIFRNCRIIGRRFRIAHVFFPGNKIIEVTTFRKSSERVERKENGLIVRDNVYGTPEEDAVRRDLTINGLFYDIGSFSVIDYVGGVEDIKNRIVRTIGDPDQSFMEDPVRMIRALRHACRTNLTIEEKTLEALHRNRERIHEANPSRLQEELYRDLRGAASCGFFRLALETGLMDVLLGELVEELRQDENHPLWARLGALDSLVEKKREFTNPVLLAVLLGTHLLPEETDLVAQGGARPDIGKIVATRIQPFAERFRISRHDCERLAQILLAWRRVRGMQEQRSLPGSLRRKSYVQEALNLFEILLLASGDPMVTIRRWRRDTAQAPPTPPPRRRRRVRRRRRRQEAAK